MMSRSRSQGTEVTIVTGAFSPLVDNGSEWIMALIGVRWSPKALEMAS